MNNSADQHADDLATEIPQATVQNRSTTSFWSSSGLIWLIPTACLAFAIVLVSLNVKSSGPTLEIHFMQGHGIKPGDTLRHRGVEVGQVTEIKMDEDLEGVRVIVTLDSKADNLARKDAQFWIVRPQVSLAGVTGLDTVIGAKYLGVLPGPVDGPRAYKFEGVESPLLMMDSEVIEITISFSEGHGLAVGDKVKYRGISVGEVTGIKLDDQLDHVFVNVRLSTNARRLAKVGSQFWIVRPNVSLGAIRGLDTVIGGQYIRVIPGAADADQLTRFDGLEAAPALVDKKQNGLEIAIECPQRTGLKRGVPITFRGVQIGQVLAVGLSLDSIAVEARAYIEPEYRQLVRTNTVFWNDSGIDVSVGLGGIEFDADSLSSIAVGSIALATPNNPGKTVATGHRFSLAFEPRDDWLTWKPRIPIGNALLPEGLTLPSPQQATLLWRVRKLGVPRSQERPGWIMMLADGRLVGPSNLLEPVEDAINNEVNLKVANVELPVDAMNIQTNGELSVYLENEKANKIQRSWPTDRLRVPTEIESVIITTSTQDAQLPVSANRLESTELGWKIDPSISIDPSWHGASVVSVDDGDLIGALIIDKTENRIALLTDDIVN